MPLKSNSYLLKCFYVIYWVLFLLQFKNDMGSVTIIFIVYYKTEFLVAISEMATTRALAF